MTIISMLLSIKFNIDMPLIITACFIVDVTLGVTLLKLLQTYSVI